MGNRDKATVVLDILAGLQMFHDDNLLGAFYADLYQAVGIMLLAPDRVTDAERRLFLDAMSRLPEPDQELMRVLLKEVMTVQAE
jgi:hypothetical protein